MKKSIKIALIILAICSALFDAYTLHKVITATEAKTSQDIINLKSVNGFTVDGNKLHIYTNSGDEYLIVK